VTDPDITREAAEAVGLASRIVLAWFDDDQDQMAALVNADVSAAVLALAGFTWQYARLVHGPDEAVRARFAEFALRADIELIDTQEQT
jgi:hypothetical protein